ncbi:MAG: ABC transporter permease subunit [Chloroflexi bacterium]|nr:ABC transporter permease subunit [Chloroflexota bacterium]
MTDSAAGSIYDLGYRNYDGIRLGRRHAIWALYLHSLRGVFGIGRSFWAKAGPIGITILAFLPAILQLGIGALATQEVNIFEPEEYYRLIQVLLAVFCAIGAPELVGRDQRTKTLSLYFSRALRRQDYALGKFAAMLTGMLSITLLPQLLMFVGKAVTGDDFGDYLRDNWEDLPAIVGSALLLSSLFAGIGLLIASQTSRRAYSTIGILAAFVLTFAIAEAIFHSADEDVGKFVLLVSPFHVFEGLTLWFFDVSPDPDRRRAMVDLPGIVFVLEAIALSSLLLALLIRRYERISA